MAHFTVMAGNGQLLPFGATLRAHCLRLPRLRPRPRLGSCAWEYSFGIQIPVRARCRSRLIKTEIHNGPQAAPAPPLHRPSAASIHRHKRLPAHSLSGVKVKENFMFYVFLHFYIFIFCFFFLCFFFTSLAKFFIIIFWTTRSACKQSLSQKKKSGSSSGSWKVSA